MPGVFHERANHPRPSKDRRNAEPGCRGNYEESDARCQLILVTVSTGLEGQRLRPGGG
jgi:hypothetical protein